MKKIIKTAYLTIILASFVFCSKVSAVILNNGSTSTVNSQQIQSQPSSTVPSSTPISATGDSSQTIKVIESRESGGAPVIFAPPQSSIQEIQSSVGSTIKGGISNAIIVPSVSGGVSQAVINAINSLEVKPTEIFTPVLSQTTNITVNALLEDNKVVYSLEAPQSTSIIKNPSLTTAIPLFNLNVDAPVEFKLKNNEMLINM